MDLDTAFAATKFLIRNAELTGDTPQINFFGGEPLLMWDEIIEPLVLWIRGIYAKPFLLSITTNGTLLTKERIEFLKQYRVSILFSIDGREETQNYNRPTHDGGESFELLRDKIPMIAEAFPNATFRMTTIPETCHNVFDNIMFAKDSGFYDFFVIPNVFEEWDEDKKEILRQEMRKYSEYYIDCYRNGTHPINFSAYDTAFRDIKLINNAILNDEFRTLNHCHACGKCGLGASHYASIHPNGDVYGCQEMTSNSNATNIFHIGNVFTGMKDHKRKALMDLYDGEILKGDDCDECPYNRICNGGCVANNYLINGSLTHVPATYCWWMRLLLAETTYVMQTLGNEENESFKEKWSKTV